jgi:2-oxoglutarate ferredoxin oxidoreductase subunit alpha
VLGWGGTLGGILEASNQLAAEGINVAHTHLRHLNPLPSDLGEVLARYEHVVVPELNSGQLRMLLRGKYLIDIKGVNVMRGRAFQVQELVDGIKQAIGLGEEVTS